MIDQIALTKYFQVPEILLENTIHDNRVNEAIDNDGILVVGLIRNGEDKFAQSLQTFLDLGIHIHLFEDGSDDNTVEILEDLNETYHNLTHESLLWNDDQLIYSKPIESHHRELYTWKRIGKFVHLRNYAVNYVKENKKNYSHVIIADFDLILSELSIKSLIQSAIYSQTKSIFTSMGLQIKTYSEVTQDLKHEASGSMIYYDTSAYRYNSDHYNPIHSHLNERLHSILGGVVQRALDTPDRYLKVDSAFGGMAIYPVEAFEHMNYQLEFNPDGSSNIQCACEHVSMNHGLRTGGYKIFIDKYSIPIYF